MISKLGWQFQLGVPLWAKDIVNGPVKIIDPPSDVLLPNATFFVGRTYMPDQDSDNLIYMGASGAEIWYRRFVPIYKDRPYINAWEGPNEPGAPWNVDFCRGLNQFTVRLGHLMHQDGFKLVGHNWSVGQPDIGQAPFFESSLEVMDYWGLHEYCAPYMNYGEMGSSGWYYWWTLRYRRAVKELRDASIRVPPIIIGECGIDGGVTTVANTPPRPKHGWKSYVPQGVNGEDWYMNDNLAWYDSEICKDSEVHSAYIFTSTPNPADWATFEVGQSLSEKIAEHRKVFVCSMPPIQYPTVNVISQMPTKKDKDGNVVPYEKRWQKNIDRTVIHHSATLSTLHEPIRYCKVFARFHIRKYGWPGIQYHFVIARDGTQYRTARNAWACYHSGSKSMNKRSMSILMLGDFTKEDPTPEQIASCQQLIARLGYPVLAHSDVVPTACPVKVKLWPMLGL